MNKLEKLLVIR